MCFLILDKRLNLHFFDMFSLYSHMHVPRDDSDFNFLACSPFLYCFQLLWELIWQILIDIDGQHPFNLLILC